VITANGIASVTVQGDFQIHTLPSGETLVYRDRDHSYWKELVEKPNGEQAGKGRLTGVSTVVGPMDWQSDNLMGWAARLDREGVAALAADSFSSSDALASLGWLASGESIGIALYGAELSWRQTRDKAATRGTAVHTHALNALASGEPVPAFEQMTGEERGYAEGITSFWLDHNPKVIAAEAVVADLELGVAGRFDLLAEIDGRIVVLDAKTSKYLSAKFVAQIAGYALLLERSGYQKPEAGAVLQVREDGSYSLIEMEIVEDDFTMALAVYRRAAEIKKRLRAAEKAAKPTEPVIVDEMAAKRAEKLERQPAND
jgi:hypothetical protein